MNLNKLKEKLYDSQYPLDDLLLEFREIAKKRENKTFLNWINNELNGYDKNNTPEYRILKNTVLFFTATDGYRQVLKSKASIQSLKVKKDNEKEFVDDVSNVKVNNGLADIQCFSFKKEEFFIIPEQGFSYLIDQHLSGGLVQSFHIVVQPSQYKTILNSVRMLLQDFIEELNKINEWEENDLSSVLMEQTFSVVINNTTNNYTNNIEKGNNNIINTGDNNVITSSYNDNIIKECLDIINAIQTPDKNVENLKLQIIQELKKCEKEKINSKPKILERITLKIIKISAAAADMATAMPLFSTLLLPLITYLEEQK